MSSKEGGKGQLRKGLPPSEGGHWLLPKACSVREFGWIRGDNHPDPISPPCSLPKRSGMPLAQQSGEEFLRCQARQQVSSTASGCDHVVTSVWDWLPQLRLEKCPAV